MAGTGITNENWHMFEPSPIETPLAVADPVRNPRAVPLLAAYQADREAAQGSYQAQLDQIHQLQVAQLQQKAVNDQRTQLLTALKDGGATPGFITALRTNPNQAGLLDGSNTSQLEAGAQAAATSKNVGEFGRGIGAAAQGGITGLTALAPASVGAPLQQGDPALVQAAKIKEAGANARHAASEGAAAGPKLSATIDPDTGGITYRVAPGKGQTLTPDGIQNALGVAPGSPLNTRLPINRGVSSNPQAASASATPSLPMAQTDAPAAAAAAPAAGDAFNNFQRSNPQGAADALALAKAKGGFQTKLVGGKMAVVGASGQSYPIQ